MVHLRSCGVGEIRPFGLNKCVFCTSGYSWVPGERIAECHTCPPLAACLGGGLVVAQSGSWRYTERHTTFFECPLPDVCLGYDPSLIVANASATNATGGRRLAAVVHSTASGEVVEGCAEGHTGPMCTKCEKGYASFGGSRCARCRPRWAAILVLAFATVLVVFVICFMVYTTLRDNRRHKSGSIRSSVQKVRAVGRVARPTAARTGTAPNFVTLWRCGCAIRRLRCHTCRCGDTPFARMLICGWFGVVRTVHLTPLPTLCHVRRPPQIAAFISQLDLQVSGRVPWPLLGNLMLTHCCFLPCSGRAPHKCCSRWRTRLAALARRC